MKNNRILALFKKDTTPTAWTWLSCMEDAYRDYVFGPVDWTDEEIEHARKVFTRLINVCGGHHCVD